MADIKHYQVHYDILANFGTAVSDFENLQRAATNASEPLVKLAAAAKDVTTACQQLREASTWTFSPTINIDPAKGKLDSLLTHADTIAKEIRATIQNALQTATGTPPTTPPKGQKGKTKNGSGKTQASKNSSATSTGLTPEVIKQWGKTFGTDTKPKTLKIQINASAKGPTGALTVIDTVNKALNNLKAAANFTISATPNAKSFESATRKLNALSKLSAKVMAPFNTTAKSPDAALTRQLTAKEKQQYGIANREITKAKNRAAAATTDAQKRSAQNTIAKHQKTIDRLTEKMKAPGYAIPVGITLLTETIAPQLEALAGKLPPLILRARLQGGNAQEQANAITGQTQTKTTSKSGGKKGTVNKGGKAFNDQKAIVSAFQDKLKNSGKNAATIPLELNTAPAMTQLEQFLAKIRNLGPQYINLAATGQPMANAGVKPPLLPVQGPTVSAPLLPASPIPGKSPVTPNESKSPSGTSKNTGTTPAKPVSGKGLEVLNKVKAALSNSALNTDLQNQIDRSLGIVPEAEKRSQRAGALWDASRAFRWMTDYEKKLIGLDGKGHNPWWISQQKQLKAQALNNALPFAKSSAERDLLVKHRKFFTRAQIATGIVPTPDMPVEQMSTYLNAVKGQMQASSVAVPWQLQSRINQTQAQIAKQQGVAPAKPSKTSSTAVPVAASANGSAYDRFKKWGLPFTGDTAFANRTPMAVDMAKGMGVMYAITGAMSAIGDSFSQAMDYQNTMTTTKAILQNSSDNFRQGAFDNMQYIVRDVGVKTKFSAPEVANAAKFLAMAGFNIESINAAIRPVADLALMGDLDLGETADKMTNIMTTFGVTPEKLRENPNIMRQMGNIMATTASRSNTDVMMLAESAKYGGGVAYMYNRNDPNLFADTMALFGVMGNAGVQGSSAGTALRMMYQNLFNPNKNQKKILAELDKDYGIKTRKADGSARSMADVISDMARNIPDNKVAEVVAKLFRITAQPGATAALFAAAQNNATELMKVAQEDGSDVNAAAHGVEKTADFISSKSGLSTLASLMRANRESEYGDILATISEQKQNTVKGLWAQVTSMFTEGVTQAFEQRMGGFEGMLKSLRDYFARPETVTMIGNLIDMIVSVGKTLAWFAKLWAGLYSTMPGLVKGWIILQMVFTQLASLLAPLIQLTGVLNRFGIRVANLIPILGSGVAGGSAGVAGAAAAGSAAANRMTARAIVGGVASNPTMLMGGMPITARGYKGSVMGPQNINTSSITALAPLSERAKRIGKIRKHRKWFRFERGFGKAFRATPSILGLTSILGYIKNIIPSLISGLGRAFGFLFNPITLVTGGLIGLGFATNYLYNKLQGTTDKQIAKYNEWTRLHAQASETITQQCQWYKDKLDSFKKPAVDIEPEEDSEEVKKRKARSAAFRSMTDGTDISVDASDKLTSKTIESLRATIDSDPRFKSALGARYEELVGNGLSRENFIPSAVSSGGTSPTQAIDNILHGAKNWAQGVQSKHFAAKLYMGAVNDPVTIEALNQIDELREQYLDKKIPESEYYVRALKIRNEVANIRDSSLRPVGDMTFEQFKQIDEPWRYRDFVQGQYNVLTDEIYGRNGSYTAKLNIHTKMANGAFEMANNYWEAIGQVIGDYDITWRYINNQSMWDKATIYLSSLPNGRVDVHKLIQTFKEKCSGYKLLIQDVGDVLTSAYATLMRDGLMPTDYNSAYNDAWEDVKHLHITKDAAKKHYNSLPEGHWAKKMYSANEYAEFATGNKEIEVNGVTLHSAKERGGIRRSIAKKIATNSVNAAKKVQEQAEKLSGNSKNNNKNTKTANGKNTTNDKTNNANDKKETAFNNIGQPSIPDYTSSMGNQGAYASNYSRDVAKPTQTNIYINDVCRFDHTAIASNAEEKEVMAALEERVFNGVYQLFATAANQAASAVNWG